LRAWAGRAVSDSANATAAKLKRIVVSPNTGQSMIPKSGHRFSGKIMLHE
jgi:hypothetical protein